MQHELQQVEFMTLFILFINFFILLECQRPDVQNPQVWKLYERRERKSIQKIPLVLGHFYGWGNKKCISELWYFPLESSGFVKSFCCPRLQAMFVNRVCQSVCSQISYLLTEGGSPYSAMHYEAIPWCNRSSPRPTPNPAHRQPKFCWHRWKRAVCSPSVRLSS